LFFELFFLFSLSGHFSLELVDGFDEIALLYLAGVHEFFEGLLVLGQYLRIALLL
jgi:hypothetical protein